MDAGKEGAFIHAAGDPPPRTFFLGRMLHGKAAIGGVGGFKVDFCPGRMVGKSRSLQRRFLGAAMIGQGSEDYIIKHIVFVLSIYLGYSCSRIAKNWNCRK